MLLLADRGAEYTVAPRFRLAWARDRASMWLATQGFHDCVVRIGIGLRQC